MRPVRSTGTLHRWTPRRRYGSSGRPGVPVESLALYGRWWQLEVWLRQLTYLVLRAAWGADWETRLHQRAAAYAANDNLVHLVGPDQPDLLGYLDFGKLLELHGDNWSLFEPFLLRRAVWDGRTVEMRAIRNRVGHVRRAGARDASGSSSCCLTWSPGSAARSCSRTVPTSRPRTLYLRSRDAVPHAS